MSPRKLRPNIFELKYDYVDIYLCLIGGEVG